MLKVSQRGRIPPFIVMDVMRAANERAESGKDILHMEIGQPSTAAPPAVIRAAQDALGKDVLGYTDALGTPQLRQRISQHYQDFYGVSVDPGRIVVTTGSSGGFILSFLSAFDAGDRVGLAAPGYPAYSNILQALDLQPVEFPVGAETHFQPTPDVLDALEDDLDGLIVASPSNPTGSMISAPAMAALTDWCDRKGVRLISDEIYHGLTYGMEPTTALTYSDDAVIINSFSKYFSMTGWRLGWMVVPEDMIRSIECLAQNLFISAPSVSQAAAVSAFDCFDELDANVRRYGENRRLLLDELPKAGFEDFAPADGAFYIYADVRHMTNDSQEFCQKILSETGVAITPGIDFDRERGAGYVRFCFAGSTDDMAEAARRLQKLLT